MADALLPQLCRIIAPDKLPDRLLLSGIIGAESQNLSEQPLLFYAFEITKTWLPSSVLLPSLVSVLESDYPNLTQAKNIDDHFEELLRNVNQQLNTVSESGETDWIGSFNGIIMLMANNELHFSQSGRYPTYLLQNNRIRQITDDIPQDGEPHPLKTFSNLASGYIQDGDCLLIANQDLYSEISLDSLRRIISSSSPFTACQTIAKQLKKDRNAKISASIIKIANTETKLPDEPQSIDLELEMQSNLKKIMRTLSPFGHKIRSQSALVARGSAMVATKAVHSAKTLTTDTLVPGAAKAAHKTTEGLKKLASTLDPASKQKKKAEVVPPSAQIIEVISPSQSDNDMDEEMADEIGSVIPASEFAIEKPLHANISPEENAPVTSNPSIDLPRILWTVRSTLHKYLQSFLVWLEVPRNKKIVALALAIALIGGTVWGALSHYRSDQNTPVTVTQNDTTLQEVDTLQQKINKAMTDPIQEIEAGKAIEEAYLKLQGLSNLTETQRKLADSAWDAITVKADILSKTTRLIEANSSAAFNVDNPQNLVVKLPYFYAYDSTKGSLFRTGKGTTSQVQEEIPLVDPSDVITNIAPGIETDTAGYALTRKDLVYRITHNGSDTSINAVTLDSGTFARGDAIATFLSNIYIMDAKTGLFWRYVGSNGTFAKGINLIDINQYDIKNSLSVAIDGSVYFLRQDGSVDKYTAKSQTLKKDTAFALRAQPYLSQKMTHPSEIMTNENMDSIYVLDKGMSSGERSTARILQFSKNGDYIRQIAFPKDFTNVKSFQISPKDNLLWVLNGKVVSEFVIP